MADNTSNNDPIRAMQRMVQRRANIKKAAGPTNTLLAFAHLMREMRPLLPEGNDELNRTAGTVADTIFERFQDKSMGELGNQEALELLKMNSEIFPSFKQAFEAGGKGGNANAIAFCDAGNKACRDAIIAVDLTIGPNNVPQGQGVTLEHKENKAVAVRDIPRLKSSPKKKSLLNRLYSKK